MTVVGRFSSRFVAHSRETPQNDKWEADSPVKSRFVPHAGWRQSHSPENNESAALPLNDEDCSHGLQNDIILFEDEIHN